MTINSDEDEIKFEEDEKVRVVKEDDTSPSSETMRMMKKKKTAMSIGRCLR